MDDIVGGDHCTLQRLYYIFIKRINVYIYYMGGIFKKIKNRK